MVGRFFRPSSREFHILLGDGIHDFDKTFVRVKGIEKLLLFLRGYPEISQANGGSKSTIYDRTIP